MPLREAFERADALRNDLMPYCDRIEIAGSIRRAKPWVNDIEIVCIPKEEPSPTASGDLFGEPAAKVMGSVRVRGFLMVVHKYAATIVKGKPATGRYVQFLARTGVKVDLFMARPDNWGYLLAIRTGSQEYSKGLAIRWSGMGYKGEDGMLTYRGEAVPLREERDLFKLLGIPWVEPSLRA